MAVPLVRLDVEAASITDLLAGIDEIDRWQTDFGKTPEAALDEAAQIFLESLQSEAPIGEEMNPRYDEGLADSIYYDILATAEGWEANYYANDYATYIIEGTAAHEIDPSGGYNPGPGGSALHFFFEGGDEAFLPSVLHPGNDVNDFRIPAWDSAEPDIREAVGDLLRVIFE
jgi:hypothetical protein